jgi:cell wall assembly regulator SMI1
MIFPANSYSSRKGELRVRVSEAWQHVERWLAAHAPEVLARFPPGASESALAAAEERLGFPLPRELRESLGVHDGNGGAFWLHEDRLGALMPVSDIIITWQMLVDLFGNGSNDASARPPAPIKRRWWHRKWVPFLHPDLGDKTCVDLDPAKGGRRGQVFYWSHTGGPEYVIAPSYAELFAGFVRELDEGRYRCEHGYQGLAYLHRVR